MFIKKIGGHSGCTVDRMARFRHPSFTQLQRKRIHSQNGKFFICVKKYPIEKQISERYVLCGILKNVWSNQKKFSITIK